MIEVAKTIPGWQTEAELIWLADQASKHVNIVEVGSWRGRSLRALADNTKGHVLAVDTWDDRAVGFKGWWSANEDSTLYEQKDWLFKEFKKNFVDKTNVTARRTTSLLAAIEASKRGDRFDMVFIDADHNYESVKQDIEHWLPLVSSGGLLCGHDYGDPFCPDVKRAVDDLLSKVEIHGTIWCFKKPARYSIITPTVLRQSLIKTCESVNNQTCKDWEHLVIVDCEISNDVLSKIAHPQRKIFRCERPHRNWGHTCRHIACDQAKGDYIYYLDDDNYLADDLVLEDLKVVTEPWAIFPIMWCGRRLFEPEPGVGKTDTGSFIIRRGVCRWPDSSDYKADGQFAQALSEKIRPQLLPDMRPLMIMPEAHVPGKVSVLSGDRVSIFTPVCSNTYLREAYESIKDQDFHEWILVFNNGGIPTDFGDPRVKVHVLYKAPEKVGTLKAYACSQATGDILLELDQDDLLLPDAVKEVKAAFVDPDVGFVYSNALHAQGDLTKRDRFTELMGWKYRENEYRGNKLDELISFPPVPEAVSRVWFGPDHLRAFRRSIYNAVGGHNPDMQVLDDSDLICRMYVKSKFVHIDKGLYVYRVHGENSWLRFNKDIQDGVYKVYDQYIRQMVEVWSNRSQLSKLEIGNPVVSNSDYTNVPNLRRKKLPSNSVGMIVSTDVLCSLEDTIAEMREISRVLVPGGWLFCQVPSTDGRGAFQDPRHVKFFNENSFLYYTNKNWAQYIGTPVRFQAPRLYTTLKNEQQVCWVVAHLINLKDGYRPCGLMEI